MEKFKSGSIYWGRFITDADSRVDVKIERRTEKSVWVKDMFTGKIERRGIKIWHGEETFKLAETMIIRAGRKAA